MPSLPLTYEKKKGLEDNKIDYLGIWKEETWREFIRHRARDFFYRTSS